jgi:glycosyltransferase involved in cell wall biosynthesis
MTSPRVLFVSHMAAISGAEQVLVDIAGDWPGSDAFTFQSGRLAETLAALGLHATSARGGDLSDIRRDQSIMGALAKVGTLMRLVRGIARAARSTDVIYANSQKAFTLSAVACVFARRKLIWHLHDIMDAAHFGKAQRRMQVALANRLASAVIVPSEAAARAFRAAGGRGDLVAIVPNGRDVSQDPRDKATLRRDLDLPDGPLVGVFSRLALWKGQDVLVWALSRTSDVKAIIVGSAMFGEDAYQAELRRLVDHLGLGNRVHFLGRREDVPLLMQAVDAVVHPSVDPEPFGLTLVEAMAVGTPVIASDAGASTEILDHGRFGTLVPAGSDAALAEAIERVIAAPDTGMVAAATAQAAARYSVTEMRRGIRTILETVASGGRP